MQRFYPTPRPKTLHDKVIKDLREKRFMPPSGSGREVDIAAVLGMDEDARTALERLISLSKSRKVGVAGRFMPDSAVSERLAHLGIAEEVDDADFFRFQSIVVPYCGVPPKLRKEWDEECYPLEDLTSPHVRRAQVALGLLRMEGAQALVIGKHEDPETLAISGGNSGARILQDTTDTARLLFSPAFGVVCQTTLSPRKATWLVQQLRHRWRDSKVTFLNTISPTMMAREEALERLLVDCERVVIVGDGGESSCEALVETALRRGKSAVVIAKPEELDIGDYSAREKIALTAGAFADAESIRAVAEVLIGK